MLYFEIFQNLSKSFTYSVYKRISKKVPKNDVNSTKVSVNVVNHPLWVPSTGNWKYHIRKSLIVQLIFTFLHFNLKCSITMETAYWMGAILRVAPPERAPRRHVRRRSVTAALLHHSPSYDLPSFWIWRKSAEKWQSYWMGAILRVAPLKMAPRRHVRRRSVAAALLHH